MMFESSSSPCAFEPQQCTIATSRRHIDVGATALHTVPGLNRD